MLILSFDTSCDDTCCAVVRAEGCRSPKFKILANIVSSQANLHRQYGGVYPTLAKREHQRNLLPTLLQALDRAGMLKTRIPKLKPQNRSAQLKSLLLKYHQPGVDLLAVTVGPGLEPCLWQGVNFAKDLAEQWNLPIAPVNHIEAHIAANWLKPVGGELKTQKSRVRSSFSGQEKPKTIKFPAVCLIVSGGHTQLILMRKLGNYKLLGETRDDAAGECLDKTARLLGLGYPGGPAIAAEAAKNTNYKFQITDKSQIFDLKFQAKLPRPMIYSKDYDFSFSGLKTAVLYDSRKQEPKTRKSRQYVREMAAEIQQAVIDVLLRKTIKSARDFQAKTIMLAGGVVSNRELRKQFKREIKKQLPGASCVMPAAVFCTDNAAMVAAAAYFRRRAVKHRISREVQADANLRLA